MTIMEPKTRKPDRRIERTRLLLRDALMQLIVEKGYHEITIQDITDRANVSRTTFYLHFKDKEELLFTGMVDLYNDLVKGYASMSREELLQYGVTETCFDPTDFVHVAQHADFYRVMVSEKGDAGFIMRVRQYLASITLQYVLEPLIVPGQTVRIPLDFLAHYTAGAQIGVISWWLENNMPYTPEQMARLMYYCCAFGAWWSIGLEVKRPEINAVLNDRAHGNGKPTT